MTTSDYRKVLAQLATRPNAAKKFERLNGKKKRSCGKANYKCKRCGSHRAHIVKYGIGLCRRCFREVAPSIGFKKYH